jgi:2-polyprenyl-3-methyl-5-hydroxy-6-metoxy-1,4-benzoquinol methylase
MSAEQPSTPGSFPAFTAESRRVWERNAVFWDEQMGEGNAFQRVLIGPTTERLLALRRGERVLELACGNGVMSRRLAQLGARVLATDYSETFVARARARSAGAEYASRLEYRVVDATDEAALLALGEGEFAAVVCNMAIMDMASIEPMFSAVRRLLAPGGRFIFALAHPCFNSSHIRLCAEEEDRAGELVTTYAVKVTRYLEPSVTRGLGMLGQPEPHYYFHRPLSVLFGVCFGAGFALDGLEEPAFDAPVDPQRALSWQNFAGIPPVLVVRARPV